MTVTHARGGAGEPDAVDEIVADWRRERPERRLVAALDGEDRARLRTLLATLLADVDQR